MAQGDRLFDLSLFSPEAQKLIEQWRENAVRTVSNIRYVTEDQRKRLNLPPATRTASKTGWVLTPEGAASLVKSNILEMPSGLLFPMAAREKISSDLAHHVGLLVPPIQIWELKSGLGNVNYFSASMRIFPDSKESPSDHLLLNDDSVSAMAIFDQWIQQMDRGRDNIIYGHPIPGAPLMLAYIDHGVTLYEPESVIPFFYHSKRPDPRKNIPEALKQEMLLKIMLSPAAKLIMANIEATPDRVIDDAVNRLPNALYASALGMGRDFFKDGLKFRRDNIRSLVQKALTL